MVKKVFVLKMWKPVLLLGVFMLAALVVPTHGQCGGILNCSTCDFLFGMTRCVSCQDGFAINVNQTACCSVGCYQDAVGFAACYANQTCVYSGCQIGFLGTKCTPCQSSIQCLTCAPGYYLTTDATQCCSNKGCNACTGTNNTDCSGCKSGWFLYQNSCDQCGTTCVSPPNGTARCDPVTGSCYYGCQPNYHGSKCQRLCNLANCNTCTYSELSDNLTCAVCVAGRYGPYCTSCNSNCLRDTGEICIHNGTCLDGCRPGYRGDKCDVSCDKTLGMANCDQCDRYQLTCTVCKPGFWGTQCQFTCGVNCVAVVGGSGLRYCDITDGTCRDGCMPTYYKSDCSGSCPNCANNVCHRTAGTCMDPICDSGFFSATCNQTCPANCGLDRNGLAYCNFTSGDCTYGCRDGFYGEKCTIGCSRFCARSPANTELAETTHANAVSSDENLSTGAIIAISAGSGVVFTLLVVAVSFTVIRSLRKRKSKNPVKHDGQVFLNMTMDATNSASSRMNVHEAHGPGIGCQTNNHVYQDLEPRNGNENDVHEYETVSRP